MGKTWLIVAGAAFAIAIVSVIIAAIKGEKGGIYIAAVSAIVGILSLALQLYPLMAEKEPDVPVTPDTPSEITDGPGNDEDTVSVPYVIGYEQTEAIKKLKEFYLTFQVLWKTENDGDVMYVIGQNPSAGTEVEKGTVVHLELSAKENTETDTEKVYYFWGVDTSGPQIIENGMPTDDPNAYKALKRVTLAFNDLNTDKTLYYCISAASASESGVVLGEYHGEAFNLSNGTYIIEAQYQVGDNEYRTLAAGRVTIQGDGAYSVNLEKID